MSYSTKVSEKLSNITVPLRRTRQVIYNTEIDIDTVIEYVWDAFVKHNRQDETTHHSTARQWFSHLNEEFQLKVLGIFEDTVCCDYLELEDDDEEIDGHTYEELRGDEGDCGSSLDNEMKERIADCLSEDKTWLERSISAYRSTIQKSEVKQVVVPFSTVEKQLNDLKEENARLKTIIEAMKKAIAG